MIAENVKKARSRVETACRRASRNCEEIVIVGVTKTFSSNFAREAVEAGILDIGENYVQELLAKKNELNNKNIHWHFIGHLQTNKVKYVAGSVELIHSVDSLRLAKEISKHCDKNKIIQDILIEVNTSGEKTKFGIEPDSVFETVNEIIQMPGLNLKGLMTIGKFSEDPEESRQEFRMLREIKNSIEQKGIELKHLSMGMTNDFEVAIEEGATIIRLGTIIFGSRQYN